MSDNSRAPVHAYFDGLCNPYNHGGFACGGWHVEPHPDLPALAAGLEGHAFYLRGRGATNNVAEYRAAIDALHAVHEAGHTGPVVLFGDSDLVVSQFNGSWKCNKPHLRVLLDRLREVASHFDVAYVLWVPREQNTCADALSRQAYREAERAERH